MTAINTLKGDGSNIVIDNINALIVGLGRVGIGHGYYSKIGNSHLSALQELRKYQIYGCDKVVVKDQRFTYLSREYLIKSDLKFDLIIDLKWY